MHGRGRLAGQPFIDDYIVTSEPIVDYLTRYSGIAPGDLDPKMSKHHITSLKVIIVTSN
jgi:PAB-dependent poly(A)-specific ribonuclease subunit 2